MVRSKLRVILFSVFSIIFFLSLFVFFAFVYYIPQTKVSLVVFKSSYLLLPFKKSFLEFYSPADRNYGTNFRSNYEINRFLIQRIETTTDSTEIKAIAHYFNLQSKAREYDIFADVSDEKKPLLVEQLIKEINDDSSNLSDKIMLLETTRTGKRIGKGTIGIMGDTEEVPKSLSSTPDEVEKWINGRFAATGVIQKYQQWWNLNLSWEEKKKINPLEGTTIKVSYCCG